MWELDYKQSWVLKNWCFWTVVLEKTLESPLDCKEIQPVHPKGNQSWIFIGRTDVEAETPILWPHHVKNWLIWKDPDAGKDWGQEEKGIKECHYEKSSIHREVQQVVVVQSLSCVQLCVTSLTAARQASLFFTVSWSLLKFMSIVSMMSSNHLILCCPCLPLPSIFPSIFPNELALWNQVAKVLELQF